MHELAHVADWNGPGGFQYFSLHWPYPALTQYATDYYGPLWPFHDWDSWAEAVTAFVFGFADPYFMNDSSWKDLDQGPTDSQMYLVRVLLERVVLICDGARAPPSCWSQ